MLMCIALCVDLLHIFTGGATTRPHEMQCLATCSTFLELGGASARRVVVAALLAWIGVCLPVFLASSAITV